MPDTARFAGMADPKCNPHLRRRWTEYHDPATLDRQADAELAHGHVMVAEHLARRAAELRESAR